ncbi:unnamed protein product, partial [marine sediment metagenome]
NDNTIYITVETEELTESLSPYMGAEGVLGVWFPDSG